ncbi:hypothetical protein Bcav_2811 [Beutenbergia cavernae DSM 12333]|uniref:Uncharacterized protein n=1 Tax=Beutenbergia cavernae (strain ATCC BAA-8 / DSM 12333 / CCUG 43141 / JCM 11478 / NBRC 16432 / NCIMB 13614 / HKI 0122) TaxID=471853 RepID=C5BYF6_BEUC1|nr:hypothetical protein [Beutenbergia cavernae]ACQ81056.1 hypothetical protein Bcav_2811 [Beutenbergia cavernae DSM 12333]
MEVVLPGTFSNPTEVVSTVLDLALGFDPRQVVEDTFRGDWRGVGRTGYAYRALVEFQEILVSDLLRHSSEAMADWDGRAADGADAYVRSLVRDIDERQAAVHGLAGIHLDLALGMQSAAETMRDAFDELEVLVLEAAGMGVVSGAGGWLPWVGDDLKARFEELLAAVRAQWNVIEQQSQQTATRVGSAADAARREGSRLGLPLSQPGGYDHPIAEAPDDNPVADGLGPDGGGDSSGEDDPAGELGPEDGAGELEPEGDAGARDPDRGDDRD